jgi:hypothetical protein
MVCNVLSQETKQLKDSDWRLLMETLPQTNVVTLFCARLPSVVIVVVAFC